MALVSVFEAVLALICFLFLCCLRNKNRSPKSFPIVGMLPELILNIHRIHDWCTETFERCHYTFLFNGPWFAKINIVGTCDPTNVHYIMSSNFNNFPKGPEFKQLFDVLGDGIFNTDMDLWRKQRMVAQEFMRNQSFHKFLAFHVIDYVAKQGLVVNLEDVFQRFTFDTTCILVTGYDPKCLSLEFPEVPFSKALDDVEEAIFYRHVRPQSFIKLQRWLKMGQEQKYRKAWEVLDDIMTKYICQKRKELDTTTKGLVSQNGEDGVDLLTSYIAEEKPTGLKCDDKFLRDTILNMMLAGTDTTSSALTWFIWLVSRHPIDLVYLHGALCEALRLYPPVPFQHKEPLKPDILPSGHPVHPTMKILFSLYAMGRIKSFWGEDCLEFKPERWINERGRIKHEPSYKFMSFNAGPRTCLGKDVAFLQMKAVASAIIYNYRTHVSEETPVVPAVSIILHTKNGLMARISTRWD
ncbi:hypothetical protein V6Z11_A11G246600 [Gossypium hirsutum]